MRGTEKVHFDYFAFTFFLSQTTLDFLREKTATSSDIYCQIETLTRTVSGHHDVPVVTITAKPVVQQFGLVNGQPRLSTSKEEVPLADRRVVVLTSRGKSSPSTPNQPCNSTKN